MTRQSLNRVLQHLRTVAAVQTYRELPDHELLERFVAARDEAAFTVLIERHGPMVLGVCRRALPRFHDAEDACQATFLVLARKAASVRKKAALASWLHGVACRVAVKLKRDHARRKRGERGAAAPAPADPANEVSWREVQALLDEELEQLPERYRAPVILCYLECRTREEAAQQLGLSPGSLHGRLERARHLLHERLSNRGLTLAAALSAAALGASVAQAALTPTFVISSTRAALLLAAGQPLTDSVAAPVLSLTQEVLKAMLRTKVKLGTAAALCAGLIAALIGDSFPAQSIAQEEKPKPVVAGSTDTLPTEKTESDTEFIRRISKDLRGTDPTPTEIHFFVASKDAGRRQKLIDLFIQERLARQQAEAKTRAIDPAELVKAAELRDRVEKERREQEKQKLKPDEKELPPLPRELNGVIEKLDPKDPAQLSISLGSDAGLTKDHTLDVYRLKPTPQYLGKIRIIEVSPQKAVARQLGNKEGLPTLKVGDKVTTVPLAISDKEKE